MVVLATIVWMMVLEMIKVVCAMIVTVGLAPAVSEPVVVVVDEMVVVDGATEVLVTVDSVVDEDVVLVGRACVLVLELRGSGPIASPFSAYEMVNGTVSRESQSSVVSLSP